MLPRWNEVGEDAGQKSFLRLGQQAYAGVSVIQSRCFKIVAFLLVSAAVFCALANAQLEQRIITTFRTTGAPTAVAVADFNGDGIPDVALVGRELQIFLGKGDGTFQSPLSYAVGAIPHSIAVADFNGNGKLDVVLG